MSKTITPELTDDETVNYQEAIRQMLAAISESNAKMERDQVEIEQLRTETRQILARLKAA
ncbi:MAG TPA: hypothetical protein VJH03_01490 [Blastocatellia bacterium]|nr:hypothetical protein [Blastocatellia bacterium]